MEKLVNFRDFGGVTAGDAGRVAAGRLFRSGQAGPLGTTPFERLHALDLALVVDLRFPDEAEHAPMAWRAGAGPQVLQLEAGDRGDAPHHAFFARQLNDVGDVHRLYADFYRFLPGDPRYRALIARAFNALADTGGPLLVHCSAGKDRTGFFCGLLLHLLGVGREAIVADFMLSAREDAKLALRPEIERRFGLHDHPLPEAAILDAILGVAPAYLDVCFDAMKGEQGTVEAWLAAIGIDAAAQARIRAQLLV